MNHTIFKYSSSMISHSKYIKILRFFVIKHLFKQRQEWVERNQMMSSCCLEYSTSSKRLFPGVTAIKLVIFHNHNIFFNCASISNEFNIYEARLGSNHILNEKRVLFLSKCEYWLKENIWAPEIQNDNPTVMYTGNGSVDWWLDQFMIPD